MPVPGKSPSHITSLLASAPLTLCSRNEFRQQGQAFHVLVSGHHEGPEVQACLVEGRLSLGWFPAGVISGLCLTPGTLPPNPWGSLDGRASLLQCHFSLQALSLCGACHPWEGAGQPLTASAQWLLGSRHTHLNAYRRQTCASVRPGAQDGTADLEASRKRSTTLWTPPTCFLLC